MSLYHHLTGIERERILLLLKDGFSYRKIANNLGVNVSTISREVGRNGGRDAYSAVAAQLNYNAKRELCHPKNKLNNDDELRSSVVRYIEQENWSPEQISGRMQLEKKHAIISTPTIYRAIRENNLGVPLSSHGSRGLARKLRHRGKTRKIQGTLTGNRGRFSEVRSHHDRPVSAEQRLYHGHWEADTVRGKVGGSALVTLVDRKIRYLLTKRVPKATSEYVKEAIISLLAQETNNFARTITPDCGKEFAKYSEIEEALNVKIYFPDPHAPQQRGTNDNTNGLIREYFPKGQIWTYSAMKRFKTSRIS